MSLGIYIHIPFCHRRCSYCDFYLTTNTRLKGNFVDSLTKEIGLFADGKNLKVNSLYFGGGTPSILNESDIYRIFECLHSNFDIAENSEITAECNPEDILDDLNKLQYFRKAGINRISLGIQSFADEELYFLTRTHDSKQALDSVIATAEIFDNYSTDIIYDLPGQQISSVDSNISKIQELKIPHISAYTLITEKGTLLYKKLLDSGQLKKSITNEHLYSYFNEKMKRLGYLHYEISNYSFSGFESLHNLKYWNFSEYLGLGPSAHSFIGGKRWNNYPDLRKYSDSLASGKLPLENLESLSPKSLEEDYFICTLRSRGVDKKQYSELFDKDFDRTYSHVIDRITNLGLGEDSRHRFSLTEKGFAVADEITFEFIKMIECQKEF